MHINRVIIKNYRALQGVDISFDPIRNIIVGPNEAGKSTLLEAINLALTGQVGGRSLLYDLHPYLFNNDAVAEYVDELRGGARPEPPYFEIELYLEGDDDESAALQGTNNSLREDTPGLMIRAEFDPRYAPEYERFIAHAEQVSTLPVEYYQVIWRTFANKNLSPRTRPLKTSMVDTGDLRYSSGPNRYIVDTLSDFLDPAERAQIALSYRRMRDAFVADDGIKAINAELEKKRGEISEKTLSIALDATSKGSWEAGIVTKLNDIPFALIGNGEQNSIKIQLALDDSSDCQIFLIEEPENHLSFTNLNRLVSKISARVARKQLFITTHSNYVLNKLGIEHVQLFRGIDTLTLNDLSESTRDYFLKLPGHDTLRLILASQKVILVEGPSDELIVQKCYRQLHGRSPLEEGIDVITVNSLAFKRFLEISEKLNIETHVVTDNDGNVAALREKYADYDALEFIHIHYDEDEAYPTLEPQLVRVNELALLNDILGKNFQSKNELSEYMQKNKTESALHIFNDNREIVIPDYIRNVVA